MNRKKNKMTKSRNKKISKSSRSRSVKRKNSILNRFTKKLFGLPKVALFSIVFAVIGVISLILASAATTSVAYNVELDSGRQSASYQVTAAKGEIVATIKSVDPKLELSISDSSGSVLATSRPTKGKNQSKSEIVEIRENVLPDTYTVTVEYKGKLKNKITTTLSINYPVTDSEEISDTTPPITVITAPLNSTVKGNVEITASVTDASGVEKVQFFVDNSLIATDTTSSYRAVWDTSKVANGSRRIMVKGYDKAGNVGSATLTVVVDNLTTPLPSSTSGIWLNRDEIKSLPQSGTAWNRLYSDAYGTWDSRNITNQDSDLKNDLLAAAIVSVAKDDANLANKVKTKLGSLVNDWDPNERSLGISRNLIGAVMAADIIGYRTAEFENWVETMLTHNFSGRTIISTHQDRANNWGTHAGGSRIAAEIFLHGKPTDNAVNVHKGWLGDFNSWPNFSVDYGLTGTSWQANPSKPVGINAANTTISGHNVDGVVPDDQRRSGGFSWPPAAEDYVYNALAPAAVTNEILARQGFDSWSWSDQAIKRAIAWLYDEANFKPADANWDGAWIAPHLVNVRYGTNYIYPTDPSHITRNQAGDSIDYVDWAKQ